jgi:hypothetical protein
MVGFVLYGLLRLPRDLSNMESLSTATLSVDGIVLIENGLLKNGCVRPSDNSVIVGGLCTE